MPTQLPELLEDLASTASRLLMAKGIAGEAACELGSEIAETVGKNWGGQLLYIPMGNSARVEKRNAELVNKFNGSNQAELAAEYKISVQRVYKILKKASRLA